MNLQEGKEVKIILSPDIYENLRKLAESRGQSFEETAGWVLGLAWETIEDEILAEIALEREKTAGSTSHLSRFTSHPSPLTSHAVKFFGHEGRKIPSLRLGERKVSLGERRYRLFSASFCTVFGVSCGSRSFKQIPFFLGTPLA